MWHSFQGVTLTLLLDASLERIFSFFLLLSPIPRELIQHSNFLVLVARVANAIAPFLATVLVPSPWSTLRSSCFSTARCRTLATNACHSDPSSDHFAKTLYTIV